MTTESLTVYIAGPMSGYKNFNYEAFSKAEKVLQGVGFKTNSPHHIDEEEGTIPGEQSWDWYMKRAIKKLTQCDFIYLLPGWSKSKGALIEYKLAKDLKMPILFHPNAETSELLV